MSQIRIRAIAGLQPQDVFTVSRTFTDEDVNRFGEISKDYNPVHYNELFAAQKNFDGCICHGLLIGSMLTEIGGQIGWLATEMTFKFKRPVYIGDRVTCTFTINSIDEKGYASGKAEFTNQNHTVVLTAQLKGIVPGRQERSLMKDSLSTA
ncbi:MaoC family dehydratase [Desulforhopalus singaporensis]|uniref:Acyl dehydratase n=1 Tax=Desulforhopalus singaporensis TaxID=91360 RepID=A0A1H0SU19_9BACT|nr:MaoC family dehydratase [Desulforhopalus singaporensis]SDP45115.1 Acyl dehydratase [Desulforhopalus singaporensis]